MTTTPEDAALLRLAKRPDPALLRLLNVPAGWRPQDDKRVTKREIAAARAALEAIATAIEAGEIAATDVQLAHLRGSIAALAAL